MIFAFPLLGGTAAYFSFRDHEHRASAALSEAVAVGGGKHRPKSSTRMCWWRSASTTFSKTGPTPRFSADEKRAARAESPRQIAGLPQVAAAWVIGADRARSQVSARVFPVDREIDQSQREDFRALQDPGHAEPISALCGRGGLDGGDYHSFFTVSSGGAQRPTNPFPRHHRGRGLRDLCRLVL